jgi:hypothetical protein
MITRNEIDIDDITDLRVVGDVIELPAAARIKGVAGEVWLLIHEVETAQNLIGRLTAAVVTARAQRRG